MKKEYILTAHGDGRRDVFDVYFHQPRYFVKTTGAGVRFSMIGPTRQGRFLVVGIARVEEER